MTAERNGKSSVGVPGKSWRSARGFTTAPESRWAPGRLALLDHGDRDVAEPLAQVGPLLEQLTGADRRRETGGARADDQDPDVDPLVRRGARLGHELGRVERRRVGGGPHPRSLRTSSVSLGTISWTSPTTARSEYSKIGAFGSLLIATIVPELCIPTLCWIAPEIPQAT